MRAIFVLIGISLGAVVTPESLHGVAAYPLSIAVLVVAIAVVGVAGARYLQLVHGWDKASAYLAASPGAMSQVIVLAAEIGADLRAVAIVQTMRVVIIAVGLPIGLALLGLANTAARRSIGGPFEPSQLGELVLLIVGSGAVAALAHRVRFPGGLLFGAMVASGVLHGSGLIHAVMPWWAVNTAQVALGAVTGARFVNTPLRLLARFVAAAFGSFAVSVGGRCGIRRRAGQPAAGARLRGTDRLRPRLGRRHDAAGAGAQPRPGLRRRASFDPHPAGVGGDAADRSPRPAPR